MTAATGAMQHSSAAAQFAATKAGATERLPSSISTVVITKPEVDPSYTTRRARGGTAISPPVAILPALPHEPFSKLSPSFCFVLSFSCVLRNS